VGRRRSRGSRTGEAMSLPVVLRHQAAEELLAACDYLEAQREGLSIRLIGEVRRVIDRISTVGIPEKTASLSSNTRRRTILNDFVIRVVASITNQSRRADAMAASLRPAGTALVPG